MMRLQLERFVELLSRLEQMISKHFSMQSTIYSNLF